MHKHCENQILMTKKKGQICHDSNTDMLGQKGVHLPVQ